MNNIELEYRSLITEEKYRKLLEFLNQNAKDLGENNKHVFHFIFPDKLLNVINLESKKQAKLALKLGKIGKGSNFEEIEIPIEQKDFEKSVQFFKSLGFTEVIESFQTRHDYEYKGVEFAVKHSGEWGYHVELEILLPDRSGLVEAEQKIRHVAEELDLKIMTEEELAAFTANIETQHRAKAQ
ncbi:MAG TPA: CYTH domain-containing protein [Candidatus Paceibacterota bacterium]|nr:CYTH domain-containing protein [Candidatus Paceibacterota bacterium]